MVPISLFFQKGGKPCACKSSCILFHVEEDVLIKIEAFLSIHAPTHHTLHLKVGMIIKFNVLKDPH